MDKHIELNVFLKKHNLAGTGGQAKVLIRSGKVCVNGTVETQNRKKLHAHDIVQVENKKFVVEESLLR